MCNQVLPKELARVHFSADGARLQTIREPRRPDPAGRAAAAGLALGPDYVQPTLLTLARLVSIGAAT